MSRLFDYLYHQRDHGAIDKSLCGKNDQGQWWSYSTSELVSHAEKASQGLIAMGLKPGDKVAIVSYANRPEWTVMDFATQMAGIISIPLYPTISPSDYEYILNQAEVQYAFCGGGDLFDKLSEAQKNTPSLKKIYSFEPDSKADFWLDTFSDEHSDRREEIMAGIKHEDLATIIYTSGTTGKPKGVMLSHRNIMHAVEQTLPILDQVAKGHNVLSFLPLCHIFERAVSMAYIKKSASVHYCAVDDLAGPDGAIRTVKPHFFSTVPRLLEKIYEAIYNKGLELTGLKKKLFFWALSLTDDYEIGDKGGLKNAIADKLIFSKWREALGGNVKLIVTGAAPCPAKMMRIFNAAGIPIREGYGLTETSPTLSLNMMGEGQATIGTVGPVIGGVDIYLDTEGEYRDGEGEILAHGPNVMIGYYKRPEENEKVFTEINGKRYFRTGDVGTFVTNKYGVKCLKITDRKKELLKTSGGKYVAPAPIENRLKEDFLIEQVMLIGDKRKFVSALIVPAEAALMKWCEENNVPYTSIEEVIQKPEVQSLYNKCVADCNPEFSHIEQVKKFKLVGQQWLPTREDGTEAELTPTMKLKRRVIEAKFAAQIDEMYD